MYTKNNSNNHAAVHGDKSPYEKRTQVLVERAVRNKLRSDILKVLLTMQTKESLFGFFKESKREVTEALAILIRSGLVACSGSLYTTNLFILNQYNVIIK